MKFDSAKKFFKKILFYLFIIFILWIFASYILFLISGKIIYKDKSSHNFICPVYCDIEYVKNSNDDNIEMLWFPNKKANKNKVYLYLHGNTGRLSYIIKNLALFGNVLSPAYPSYSTSTGNPNTKNINEIVDLSINFLHDKGFEDKDIVIIGHSLGGSPAVYSAVKYPKLSKVILINTFYSIKKMCEMNYGPLCIFAGNIHNSAKMAPSAKAEIKQFHNPKDELIPISQGEELFNLLGSEDKQFFKIPGTHANFPVAEILNK